MKNLALCAITALTISTFLLPAGFAQQPKESGLAKVRSAAKPDLDAAIHDYLLTHPEVVLESVRAFDAHQKQIAAERVRGNVRSHLAELTAGVSPAPSVAGGPAPVTVVEFFDYRCGYCKKAAPTVLGLSGTAGVRVLYKELPILGSDSMVAAQAALAARMQGRYDKLHDAMLVSEAPLTADVIYKLAADSGIDVERLKKDMDSPAVKAEISRNLDIAQKLNVEATPTFVVGDQMISGALTPQAFQDLIDKARDSKEPAAPVATAQLASHPAR